MSARFPTPSTGRRWSRSSRPTQAQTSPDFIKDYLRERVSAYKVPRHYLYRTDEQIPRVASGKISLPLLRQEAERELRAPAVAEGTR